MPNRLLDTYRLSAKKYRQSVMGGFLNLAENVDEGSCKPATRKETARSKLFPTVIHTAGLLTS